uniref:Uncharacterized protein n=1 Tax=Arundo donax TaxID=35708 RepID=A0A0A9E1I1_ARUDO
MWWLLSPLPRRSTGVRREPHAETVTLARTSSVLAIAGLELLATTPTHRFVLPSALPLRSSSSFSALHPVRTTAPRLTASTSHVVSVPRLSPVRQPYPQLPQ